MICTDTNIIVYIAQGTLPANIYGTSPVIAPSIIKIEALGFRHITAQEEHIIRKLLDRHIALIALSDAIIERAIALRQIKKLSLGDAIVAATALEHNCELWTANLVDYQDIEGLSTHNPLPSSTKR